MWSAEAPDASRLLLVGEWVLVGGDDAALAGYDRDGETVLPPREGAAVRIDPSSVLLFSTGPDFYPQDLAVAGLQIGRDRVELGQLAGVYGARCSWNEAYLACPGEESAGIWRFTDA